MIIKVDVREQEMFKLIKYYLEISPSYKNITIVSENLPLGDVIICDENNVERLIIERKSIRDLSSSIKDGRYEEQSYRLNGSPFSNHNIIYLIEGDLNSKFLFKDRIDKISLYSAKVIRSLFNNSVALSIFFISLTCSSFFNSVCNFFISLMCSKSNFFNSKLLYSLTFFLQLSNS